MRYSKELVEDGITFTITRLSKKLEWDRDTVAKWINPAIKKSYLTVVVESKGSKGAEYMLEEKELPSDSFLPTIKELIGDNPNEEVKNIYNPLMGEVVFLEFEPEIPSTDAPIEFEGTKNTSPDNLTDKKF